MPRGQGRVIIDGRTECGRCHERKRVVEFTRDDRSSIGLRSYCRSCSTAQNKQWVAAHRELWNEYQAQKARERRQGAAE